MTVLRFLFGGALCLILGCSSLPPAGVENGQYINPKYQIAFEVPPSPPWYQSKELPDRYVPRSTSWICRLGSFNDILFVNDIKNGAIAVELDKTWHDLGIIPPQKINLIIEKETIEYRKSMRSAPFISRYDYKITAPYVSIIPLPLLTENFVLKNHQTKYRCEIRTYVYTINEDDTCRLRFYLWSAPKSYEQNKTAFDNLIKTLRRTSPQDLVLLSNKVLP